MSRKVRESELWDTFDYSAVPVKDLTLEQIGRMLKADPSELPKKINWDFPHTLFKYSDVEHLEKKGVWPSPVPEWVRYVSRNLGCGTGAAIIVLTAARWEIINLREEIADLKSR